MIDFHRLFDDAGHSTAPPSEEPQHIPQVRMSPAKQGPADDRLLSVEVGHIGGFTRERENARLESIRRDEAMEEAKERKRMADAKDAAARRKAEADARKEAEKAESMKRRERWLLEDRK